MDFNYKTLTIKTMANKTKTKKIINWNNYVPEEGEVNSGEILLVEDQSYTIEEILEKFTKGIVIAVARDPQYSDSDDFNDVDLGSQIKDLTDVEDLVAERNERKRAKRVIPDNKQESAPPPQSGAANERDLSGENPKSEV